MDRSYRSYDDKYYEDIRTYEMLARIMKNEFLDYSAKFSIIYGIK